MRITIFTEVFLPKIDGVVTRLTRSIEQLVELGHDVQVIAPGHPVDKFAGCEVVSVPSVPLWPIYPENTIGFPGIKVIRKVRDFNPDIIHAVNPIWVAAFGARYASAHSLPLIASFHTNVPEYTESLGIGWASRPMKWWVRHFHSLAAKNLVTSLPMVSKAHALGLTNIDLWPKAVDTDGYAPSKASPTMRARLTNGHPESPTLIYVGRISAEKNLEILGPIMNRVKNVIPNARLALVGKGPQFDHLKSHLDPEWSHFMGYLSGPDLQSAFASADAFLFPSATETLGLVALESFASGVPVIGARAGGIPFIIDDGTTGYLVDPHDPAAWSDRIIHLLRDDHLRSRMGRAARREAEKYSWRAATEKLVEFYQFTLDQS